MTNPINRKVKHLRKLNSQNSLEDQWQLAKLRR